MDLTFTQEQQLLKQSAERYLAQRYSFADRQHYCANPKGWDSKVWSDFSEFGWLALPFHIDRGGMGGDAIELAILGQAFGAALVVEPYLPSIVLGGFLLEQSSSLAAAPGRSGGRTSGLVDGLVDGLIDGLMAGKTLVTLAHDEPSGRVAAAPITSVARRQNDHWVLSGTKIMVRAAGSADHYLVSAKLEDTGGKSALFIVPVNANGLKLTPYDLIDGSRAGDLELNQVAVRLEDRLGDSTNSTESESVSNLGDSTDRLIQTALERAMVFAASAAAGSMRAVLDATVAYTKTRQQFGQPLAANQVVKHRLVDMAIACEEASAIALRAALIGDSSSARAAKIKVSRAARFVAEQSIQLHGGMGVTEELNIGAYFKQLLAFEMSFGSARHHAQTQFSALRQRATGVAA